MTDTDFDEYEVEDSSEDQGSETESIAQVRDWGKRQERAAKSWEKKYAKLEEQWNARVQADNEAVIEATGLSEGHRALFQKTFEGDVVTADGIKEWAKQYEIPLGTQPAAEPEPEPEPAGFNPVMSGGTSPGARQLTVQEAVDLARQDRAKYVADVKAGRIIPPTDFGPSRL